MALWEASDRPLLETAETADSHFAGALKRHGGPTTMHRPAFGSTCYSSRRAAPSCRTEFCGASAGLVDIPAPLRPAALCKRLS